MATVEKLAAITVDPEVQAAIDRASRGSAIPIPCVRLRNAWTRCAKKCESALGNVNLAVPLIRETRDSA